MPDQEKLGRVMDEKTQPVLLQSLQDEFLDVLELGEF
jgi:hypothetical protein